MHSLLSLDLSGNNLTGPIPSCLLEFENLGFLDLSRNNLHGTVPRILHLNYSSSLPTGFGLNLS
ncbi:hypothetical protein MKW94_025595, partial [Papaver nudicaule]|nr:hypothetical protein [Papaver nudicaule]